jgi:hypothetical protein
VRDRATVDIADAKRGDNRSPVRSDEGNPSPADIHPLRAPDRFHLALAIAHLEQFVSLTRSMMHQVGGGCARNVSPMPWIARMKLEPGRPRTSYIAVFSEQSS